MKGSSWKTELMGMECTSTRMGQSTWVTGLMTSRMVMARKSGKMVPSMMASSRRVRSMAPGITNGVMDLLTPGLGLIITSTVKAGTSGPTAAVTPDSGVKTNFTVREPIYGLMVESTKENTMTIKKKVLAPIIGQMVSVMRASGFKVSSTARAKSLIRRENLVVDSGKTVSVSPG